MSTRRLVVPAQATAAPSVGSIPRSRMTEIEQAVVVTMAYADLFDYPPTREELHRYLVGTAAAPAEVDAAIARLIGRHLEQRDNYLCINGREEIFEIRTRRHRASPPRWTAARRYARALSRWPFVRMVAVCGSLAMDNVDEDGTSMSSVSPLLGGSGGDRRRPCSCVGGQDSPVSACARTTSCRRKVCCSRTAIFRRHARSSRRCRSPARRSTTSSSPRTGGWMLCYRTRAPAEWSTAIPRLGTVIAPDASARSSSDWPPDASDRRLMRRSTASCCATTLRLRSRGVTLQQLRHSYRRDRQLVVGGGYRSTVRSRLERRLAVLLGELEASTTIDALLPAPDHKATSGDPAAPAVYEQQFDARYGRQR